MRKTTNYENILFQDAFDKQLDPTDATWVLQFVRDNFTILDFVDMFEDYDELIEEMIEESFESFNEFIIFRNEEELIQYIKDQYYPTKFWTKKQLEKLLKEMS